MDSDIPNWLFLSNHLEYRETFVAIFLALDFISLTSLFSLLIFYRLRFAFSFPLVFSECLGWTSLCFYGITLFLKSLISNKYWCQEWWACGHRGFFALSFCCLWTLSLMRVFRVVTQSHMPRVLWVRNKASSKPTFCRTESIQPGLFTAKESVTSVFPLSRASSSFITLLQRMRGFSKTYYII